MKQIGILTFQFASNKNFGGILQTYAVQTMIKNQNYKVNLINYKPLKKSIKIIRVIKNIKSNFLTNLEGKGFIEFHNKFFNTTKKCKTIEELKLLNKEFDTFVVGSDQVWRPTWLGEAISHYYFDFVDNKNKKIAYAASFGISSLDATPQLTEQLKNLAQRFDYVSVREESGIKICNDVFGIDAICVLDPTLMIDKKDYQPILDDWKDESHKKKKYIAHMLLDDTVELRDESNNIGKYLKSEINYIKGKDRKILGKTITFYNKVSQWLTYVKDAELVITDSFHCTVFSLIFNKKFVVVANSERGTARLENLLGIVGLKDRFFTNIKDILKSGILDKNIDYIEVEKKLNVHREYSMNFLKKALGENNE